MTLKKKISKNNLNVEKRSKKIDEWFIPRDRSAFYDTHDFHPYFAAYPPNLVSRILDKYGKNRKTLLDPFMGGGSAVIEGVRNGYNTIGVDISEFSKFITHAKTKPFKINKKISEQLIKKITKTINIYRAGKLNINFIKIPEITNSDKWFNKDSLFELSIIFNFILEINNNNHKNFFLLCLSSILRSCSNAKNAQQHLNIKKEKKIPNTLVLFKKKLELMQNQMENYYKFFKIKKIKPQFKLYSDDVRKLSDIIKKNSIDIVITSPPYGTGSRYTDIYRLHFEFFGLNKPTSKRSLEKNKNFNDELNIGFKEIFKVMKKNSYFFCVYGDPSTEDSITLKAINNCKKIGFKYLGLISCPIEKTVKKHHTSYKRFIPKDFILIFKKN